MRDSIQSDFRSIRAAFVMAEHSRLSSAESVIDMPDATVSRHACNLGNQIGVSLLERAPAEGHHTSAAVRFVDGWRIRLPPPLRLTVLGDTVLALPGGQPAPATRDIWQSSRFALDFPPSTPNGAGGIAVGTCKLFVTTLERWHSRNPGRIETVTGMWVQRIPRRAGWPLDRLCQPQRIVSVRAVAGFLDVSEGYPMTVLRNGGLHGPLSSEPIVARAV